MAILPKMLRQLSTGRLFNYSEKLAGRADMVPHWPDGVDPNHPQEQRSGLNVSHMREDQLQRALEERETLLRQAGEIMDKKDAEISDLRERLAKAHEQVNQLIDQLNEKATDPPAEDTPPNGQSSRQELINTAVAEMYADGNAEDFTVTSNLPRIGSVEARCPFKDVTAEERDLAVEVYNANKE